MNTLWLHTRIGMTSHTVYLWLHNNIYDISATAFLKTQLYLTSHPLYLASQPLYLCCHNHCIDRSQQFWKLSHLAHIWHRTHSRWHHNHTLWHHYSVFMKSQPLHSWHQIPWTWHQLQGLWHLIPYHCDITDTIFVNTYQLSLTSNTRCRDNTTTISETTTSICVSMWSHTLYRWYKTHCIYDMAPTIFMAQYALYMTSHPRFVTSQHSIHYISLLYLILNWLYLTALPLYLCNHTQIINHITHIVHMTTQAQYVSHFTNTYDIISTLDDIIPRYDLHTHCIHVIIPRIPVIASTAAELLLTVYWVYQICNMCDLKPTICVASHEFYVTLQQLIKTSEDCIHDITPTVYDITYTLLVSFFCPSWLLLSTSPVSLSSHPDYQSYNPYCTYDNTGTICITSYEYIWHHIHSWWYHTTVWPSHTLYSCYHTEDTCHRIHCSWAITYSVLSILNLQYVWSHTHYMYGITWILCDITTSR